MVRTELLRVRKGLHGLSPMYLRKNKSDYADRAAMALECFRDNVGSRRVELDAAVAEIVQQPGDSRVIRAFVEILERSATFESSEEIPASEIRTALFLEGAKRFPVGSAHRREQRDEALLEVAQRFGLAPESLSAAMFKDLKDEQLMTALPEMDPEELIQRYNVGLAQGLLLHAAQMEITLPDASPSQLRQLVRYLKFFRLLFAVKTQLDGNLAVTVDGPRSVLKETRAYGVRLGNFLPALLLLPSFRLVAPVVWKRRREVFTLSSDDGLVSHYRNVGAWVPREVQAFRDRLEEVCPPGWALTDGGLVTSLRGRDIYAPDFTLLTPGGEFSLEILWPWRKINWTSYYALFAESASEKSLLMVPRKLVSTSFLDSTRDPRLLFYRATPLAPEVVKRIAAI